MKQLVLLAMLGMLMLSLSFGQGETASMKTYRKEKYQDVLLIMTAARTGIAKAQHALGEMYQNGTHGVPVNHVEALKWYRAAADQGYPDAQERLSYIYSQYSMFDAAGPNPWGVVGDSAEAKRWLKKAFAGYLERAMQGDATAQRTIGDMYDVGTVVPKDQIRAYAWWNLAAALGGKALGDGANGDLILKDVLSSIFIAREKLTDRQIIQAQKLSIDLWNEIYSRQ